MNPEERLHNRLREALHDRADQIEVDLPRVHDLTEAKLAAPRHRRTWPLLAAAAAAVAVVAAGVTILGRSGAPSPTHPPAVSGPHGPYAPHGPQPGDVVTRFSCPHRSTVRFDPVAKDLSFVPSLEHGPRWFAAQMEAPRFAFQVNGDTATLRLGNADGSLGSVSTFARAADGRWQVVRATKCVNGPQLATNRVTRQMSAPSIPTQQAQDLAHGCGAPTFVDGTGYYDTAGLLRHAWTFAARCPDGSARLTMATGTGTAAAPLPASGTPKPVDLSRLLPGEVRGQVALWALFDPHHSVADLSAQLNDGRSVAARVVALHGHQGTVYLVLAPRTELARLAVRPIQGTTRSYTAVNPPGWRQ